MLPCFALLLKSQEPIRINMCLEDHDPLFPRKMALRYFAGHSWETMTAFLERKGSTKSW